MASATQVRVYTDGACPLCRWSRRKYVDPYDTEKRIDFRDFNDPAVAAETPYSRGELDREMHVLAPDGQWHSGYSGWIAVLRALPRRRWLARIMNWLPFRWIGPFLYRIVARNRYRLSRLFPRWFGPACDTTCRVA